MAHKHDFLRGGAIDLKPVTGSMTVADLVDSAFLAYNAARLRESCRLFVGKLANQSSLSTDDLGMQARVITRTTLTLTEYVKRR